MNRCVFALSTAANADNGHTPLNTRETDLIKSGKMSAEEKFAAALNEAEVARTERDLAQEERMANIAKLRSLRLTKEAADKVIEDQIKAEKAKKKSAIKAKR